MDRKADLQRKIREALEKLDRMTPEERKWFIIGQEGETFEEWLKRRRSEKSTTT